MRADEVAMVDLWHRHGQPHSIAYGDGSGCRHYDSLVALHGGHAALAVFNTDGTHCHRAVVVGIPRGNAQLDGFDTARNVYFDLHVALNES